MPVHRSTHAARLMFVRTVDPKRSNHQRGPQDELRVVITGTHGQAGRLTMVMSGARRLNTEIILTKPLTPPVSGIIGKATSTTATGALGIVACPLDLFAGFMLMHHQAA